MAWALRSPVEHTWELHELHDWTGLKTPRTPGQRDNISQGARRDRRNRPRLKDLLAKLKRSENAESQLYQVVGQIQIQVSKVSEVSHSTSFESETSVLSTEGAVVTAICLQGSGPHFCPGGNPNASRRSGENHFQVQPFSMFLAIVRLKEFGGPITVALQGLVLGGGLAMAMLADLRVLDVNASVCFGNLSRGMVPCMFLSLMLPSLGVTEALDFYLTDDLLSAAAWLEKTHGGTHDVLVDGSGAAKSEAFAALRRSSFAAAPALSAADLPLRFATEAAALQLSLKFEAPTVFFTHIAPESQTEKEEHVKLQQNTLEVPEVPESTSFSLDFLQKRILSLNPLQLAQSMSRATPRLRSQIGVPRRPRWRWQQCEGMEQVLPMLLNLLRLLEISSVYRTGRWFTNLRPVQA